MNKKKNNCGKPQVKSSVCQSVVFTLPVLEPTRALINAHFGFHLHVETTTFGVIRWKSVFRRNNTGNDYLKKLQISDPFQGQTDLLC